jgi:hypothetical protein
MTALNTGNAKASLSTRGDDLYETPQEATRALLEVETFTSAVWEPACGPGAIVNVLRETGHRVYATDLVAYGLPDSESGVDFLMERQQPGFYIGALVTNPPFKLANEFVTHALALGIPKVAMLLRLGFIESERRSAILDGGMLARVHVFRNRLPMMHRAGRGTQVAKSNSSAMAFAWYIWEQTHTGPTEIRRISWRAAPLSPDKHGGE